MKTKVGLVLIASMFLFMGATEPTCFVPTEYAMEGDACGDDIDTQCADGLYCALGEVDCGTPPVIGVCRPMGTCGNEFDCQDENNIWDRILCVGDVVCEAGACGVDCSTEVDCLDLPVEECEANGCEVFSAHPYNPEAGCHQEESQPAFCRADPDIVCVWEGEPIVLTEPDGFAWYVDWSCFSTPEGWDVEYVSEGTPACEQGALEGEACGDDIGVQCADGLYCAFGEVWCGTPPVVGVCRAMGTCGNEYDCLNVENEWHRIDCVGDTVCHEGSCAVDCSTQPDCLDLPVEECEANGCQVFLAHPYLPDDGCYMPDGGCHLEELQPAFCQADPDIVCGWQGDPIVLTEPDGTAWYIGWSCFSTPEGWDVEWVPEGKPVCEQSAPEGEACGDDIGVQCADGLYCAFGEVWCGTPPVVGVCRSMGTCGNEYDCLNEDNLWDRIECEGDVVCQDGTCGVDCGTGVDCLALPVDECEANGCEVFMAYPYVPDAYCHLPELQPAFCRADPDIVCAWEGAPIVLVEPDGSAWYVGWSCFTTPADWVVEDASDGKPPCG